MGQREPVSPSRTPSYETQAARLEASPHPEEEQQQIFQANRRQRAAERITLPSVRHGFDFSQPCHRTHTTTTVFEPTIHTAEDERMSKENELRRPERCSEQDRQLHREPQPLHPDHTADYERIDYLVSNTVMPGRQERRQPEQDQRKLPLPFRHPHSYPSTPQLHDQADEHQNRDRTVSLQSYWDRSVADSHARLSAFTQAALPHSLSESYPCYPSYPSCRQARSSSGPPSVASPPYPPPQPRLESHEVIRPVAVYAFPPSVYQPRASSSYAYPQPQLLHDERPPPDPQPPHAGSQLLPLASRSTSRSTDLHAAHAARSSRQQPSYSRQGQSRQRQNRRRTSHEDDDDDDGKDEDYMSESPRSPTGAPHRGRSALSAHGGDTIGPRTVARTRRRAVERRASVSSTQQRNTLQDTSASRGKRHQMSVETRAMMAALLRAEQDMQRERELGIPPQRHGSEPSSSANSSRLGGRPGSVAAGTRPRWTLRERSKLFYAVVAEKQLEDMGTFNWAKIARVVNRQEKACKDQWRRETLPFCRRQFRLELPLEESTHRPAQRATKGQRGNGHQEEPEQVQEEPEDYEGGQHGGHGEREAQSLDEEQSSSNDSDDTYYDQLDEEDEEDMEADAEDA